MADTDAAVLDAVQAMETGPLKRYRRMIELGELDENQKGLPNGLNLFKAAPKGHKISWRPPGNHCNIFIIPTSC